MRVTVYQPTKTPTSYSFSLVRDSPLSIRRILRVLSGNRYSKGYKETIGGREIKFGFTTDNFELSHHEVWDSFYPLFYLVRKGGPIFDYTERAVIHFKYPIHIDVRDFFVERARNMGIELKVTGDTYRTKFDLPTSGHILSLGGGKESRLLLGMLRELGKDPVCVTQGAVRAKGVDGVLTTKSPRHDFVTRVMPALMLMPEFHYMGNTALGSMLTKPWQRYYDISAAKPLAEMSALFNSLGININMVSPTSVLCNNIQQLILHRRYPELFKNQRSVVPEERSQKNLHISLCRMRHGIPFHEHCSIPLFKLLIKDFVHTCLNDPTSLYGTRHGDKYMIHEMQSMIAELKHRPEFDEVREHVPDSWRLRWFDYVHSYLNPDLPEEFLNIYKQYIPDISECPREDVFFLPH